MMLFLKRWRKGFLAAAFICHCLALTWWNLGPHLTGYGKGRAGAMTRASAAYVNLLGLDQYWDFFAPTAPVSQHYLSICTDLESAPAGTIHNCRGRPLFASYRGTLDAASSTFGGPDSRLYRLAENLIAAGNDELFRQLLHYYARQAARGIDVYLLHHDFYLVPRARNPAERYQRQDRIVAVLRADAR